MSEKKLGTDKIEAIANSAKKLVVLGKKVSADGKVDLNDLAHVVGFMAELPKIIEDFKSFSEAFEQIKDIDVAEAVDLIQKIHSKVKEVEAA